MADTTPAPIGADAALGSERLKHHFGADARKWIDALEQRLRDAQEAQATQDVDALLDALAECRDAFTIPEEGGDLRCYWEAAIGNPGAVPDYVKKQVGWLSRDAEDAARLDWLTFNISGKALRAIGVEWPEHGDVRKAIDAARTKQGHKP